mmetsp:Transcript_26204/g.84620  ORF Transcript_26204/g.84620 Transcript_26204/m.84620 type:complete len:256 (+) Transcript_26204:979-1746(+)
MYHPPHRPLLPLPASPLQLAIRSRPRPRAGRASLASRICRSPTQPPLVQRRPGIALEAQCHAASMPAPLSTKFQWGWGWVRRHCPPAPISRPRCRWASPFGILASHPQALLQATRPRARAHAAWALPLVLPSAPATRPCQPQATPSRPRRPRAPPRRRLVPARTEARSTTIRSACLAIWKWRQWLRRARLQRWTRCGRGCGWTGRRFPTPRRRRSPPTGLYRESPARRLPERRCVRSGRRCGGGRCRACARRNRW